MVPARTHRLLVWATLAIGLLVLTEGALRYEHGHPGGGEGVEGVPPGMFVADRHTGVTLRPGFVDPEGGFTVNSAGLRDPERPPPRGAHWLLLGDELAAGLGVGDDEHLARLLELGLSTSRDPAPEVWNGGVPRFGPEQVLMRSRTLSASLRLDPQVVLLAVHLGNDARDAARGPGVDRVVDGRLVEVPWGPWPGSAFNGDRGRGSFLGRRLRRSYAIPAALDLYLEPASSPVERGWSITERALAQLAGETRGTLVVLGIPGRLEGDTAVLEEELARGAALAGRAVDVDAPQRRLEAITTALDVPLILLRPALRASTEPTWYRDRDLLTAQGHRIVARTVLEQLAGRGIGPRLDLARVDAALLGRTPRSQAR